MELAYLLRMLDLTRTRTSPCFQAQQISTKLIEHTAPHTTADLQSATITRTHNTSSTWSQDFVNS